MTNRERTLSMSIAAAFAAFGTWLWFYNRPHMDFFCQEDGFVEYSEAFLYLFAAGLFFYVGMHKRFRNVWYFGYALLFFGVCGEEVSWGQRIFNIATPDRLDAINVQQEINIHNIDGLHQHHHLYGILVCSMICFWIPLTARYLPAFRRLYARLNMPVFPLWTWPLPAMAFAFMIVPRLFGHNIFNFDELGELYLALAFFGFGTSVYAAARPAIDPELAAAGADAEAAVPAAAAHAAQPSVVASRSSLA
jgi:hypothetical protein